MSTSHITPESGTEHHGGHEVRFSVDGDELKTPRAELTADQILALAGIDPKTHYLVEIEGHRQISYKDEPHKHIHMRDGLQFISVSTGPTPVS